MYCERLMSKKILLVSGDSFTAGSAKIGQTYVWPDVLADKLDMQCVNVGRGGVGNEFIHNMMIDAMCEYENKIGLAICFWSMFERWDFYGKTFLLYPNTFHNEPELLKKSVRYIHSFQNHCEFYKLPYLQMQAFEPTETITKDIFDIPQFDKINSKFIGWPMYQEIGGYHMSDKLDDIDPDRKTHRVGRNDTHPNDRGHEFIADFFYEKYKELY